MRTPVCWLVALALGAVASCASGPSPARTTEVAVPASLAMTDIDGRDLDLDAALADGKAVALVWWQTWCSSCKREAPELVAAARQHGDRVTFVGIVPGADSNVDDGEVRETAQELGLVYPTVRDRDLAWTRAFGIEGTPTIVVLRGSPAQVVYRGHRPPDFGALVAGAP